MRTRLRSWVRVIPAGKRAAGRRHRLTGTMMVRFQPLGRQILSWAAEEELFTASGAVAKGKHLPVGILPLPAHTAPPHRRGAATSSAHTHVLRPNNAVACWQTQGWPLTDFATASAIAIAYLVFVVFGSAIMSQLPSMQVDTAHPALPSCGAMLTPRLLVTLRAQDYTFPLRFLYNLMQVGLCSYMTIEAGILAYRNNYRSHFLCVKMPCVCARACVCVCVCVCVCMSV